MILAQIYYRVDPTWLLKSCFLLIGSLCDEFSNYTASLLVSEIYHRPSKYRNSLWAPRGSPWLGALHGNENFNSKFNGSQPTSCFFLKNVSQSMVKGFKLAYLVSLVVQISLASTSLCTYKLVFWIQCEDTPHICFWKAYTMGPSLVPRSWRGSWFQPKCTFNHSLTSLQIW